MTNKMNETKTTKEVNWKKPVLGVGTLAVIVIALLAVYFNFGPKAVQGAKSITIEVIDDKEATTVYEVNTDAEYLREALEEAEGLEVTGTESEYGLMVDTVNGLVADYNVNGAYWSFYVDGAYCMSGIDTQPVEDGQSFQIIYTVD